MDKIKSAVIQEKCAKVKNKKNKTKPKKTEQEKCATSISKDETRTKSTLQLKTTRKTETF